MGEEAAVLGVLWHNPDRLWPADVDTRSPGMERQLRTQVE
jgi:hypothetical protein